MKRYKLYFMLVVLLLIGLFVFSLKHSKFESTAIVDNASETSEVEATEAIDLENITDENEMTMAMVGDTTLKVDPLTTNVVLYENGKKKLETIPEENFNSGDSMLSSPIVVNYKLTNTSAESTLYGYDDSIEKGNYTIEKIADGVKITYTLGEEIVPIDQLPQAVEEKRFEDLLDKVSPEEQTTLNSYYNYSSEKKAYIRPPEIKPSKVQGLYDIFYTSGGYTSEDLAEDSKILGDTDVQVSEPISFVVPVEYTVDENGDLQVAIDTNDVKISGVNEVTSISILPGMMAQSTGNFLIPDGSGAIIDTTTTKQVSKYSKQYSPITEDVLGEYSDIVSESLMLPIFANSSTLAIIDNGAAATSLNVDLSAKQKLIYPEINYQYEKYYELNTSGNGINLSSIPSQGEVAITYIAHEQEQTYYDYAQDVANYYKQKYELQSIDSFDLTTNLEIIGSYNMKNYLLGIPYDDLAKLTDYSQIEEMLKALNTDSKYNLILYGWSNQGLVANMLDLEQNKVCGKNENQLPVSYAVNMLTVNEQNMGDFNAHTDVINGLEGDANKMYPIQNSSFEENQLESGYYYISPRKIEDITNQFIKKFDSSDSITITDAGQLGYADYKQNEEITPIDAEEILMNSLSALNEAYNLTIDSPILERGFESDNIIDLPTTSSNNDIFDYDVPFVQLVYSQLIPTANTAINLNNSGDVNTSLMKAMEVKNNLSYTVAFEDTAQLKNSQFDEYYAIQFDYWKDIINQNQEEYNKFLAAIDNSKIVNHQIVAENVSKVTYENGKVAYFNYNSYDVVVDGVKVDAENYLIKGGK